MDSILYEVDNAVAVITLNRPDKFNSFNARMRADMLDAVLKAEQDDDVRIVIIKGNGRGFCAGADLSEGIEGNSVENQLENEYKPFLMAMHEGKKIYIAQVHKTAAGIGGTLAMTCDFCVMDDGANIYLAFAAIGLIPDGGKTWQLLHGMGYSRALQAIIEGHKISAQTCLALGMINKVVPVEKLDQVTREWANELSKGAPLAQQAAKRLLKQVGSMSYKNAISLEAKEQAVLTNSEDCKNAVEAFLNKEKPVFTGK